MYKFWILLLFFSSFLNAQDLPMGYLKYFEASFQTGKINKQFYSAKYTSAKLSKGILTIKEMSDTTNVGLPSAYMLIDNNIFGDFVADISVKVNDEHIDSLSGFYLIAGFRDSANYYFIQCKTSGADFYKMYKGEVSLIDSDSNFFFANNSWQNLRVTRDILGRTISLEASSQKTSFTDPNLVMGYFGLGVSDYIFSLRKMRVWAPTAISKKL